MSNLDIESLLKSTLENFSNTRHNLDASSKKYLLEKDDTKFDPKADSILNWTFTKGRRIKCDDWSVEIPDGFIARNPTESWRGFELVPKGCKKNSISDEVTIYPSARNDKYSESNSEFLRNTYLPESRKSLADLRCNIPFVASNSYDCFSAAWDDIYGVVIVNKISTSYYTHIISIFNDKCSVNFCIDAGNITKAKQEILYDSITRFMKTFKFDKPNSLVKKNILFDKLSCYNSIKNGNMNQLEEAVQEGNREMVFSYEIGFKALEILSSKVTYNDKFNKKIKDLLIRTHSIAQFYYLKAHELVKKLQADGVSEKIMKNVYKVLSDLAVPPEKLKVDGNTTITVKLPEIINSSNKAWKNGYSINISSESATTKNSTKSKTTTVSSKADNEKPSIGKVFPEYLKDREEQKKYLLNNLKKEVSPLSVKEIREKFPYCKNAEYMSSAKITSLLIELTNNGKVNREKYGDVYRYSINNKKNKDRELAPPKKATPKLDSQNVSSPTGSSEDEKSKVQNKTAEITIKKREKTPEEKAKIIQLTERIEMLKIDIARIEMKIQHDILSYAKKKEVKKKQLKEKLLNDIATELDTSIRNAEMEMRKILAQIQANEAAKRSLGQQLYEHSASKSKTKKAIKERNAETDSLNKRYCVIKNEVDELTEEKRIKIAILQSEINRINIAITNIDSESADIKSQLKNMQKMLSDAEQQLNKLQIE